MYALSLLGSKVNSALDFDPRIESDDKRPPPVRDLGDNKKVKIGSDLDSGTRAELTKVLQKNKASFAWCASDMVGINPKVIAPRLNIDPRAKL